MTQKKPPTATPVLRAELRISAPGALTLVANHYPKLEGALSEAIQNAIDSGASRVHITICLQGKGASRFIEVMDNGCGMSRDMFTGKLSGIASSEKRSDASKLGNFGIGLLSFHGKARHYQVTTTLKDVKGTPGWEGYYRHDLANISESEGRLYSNGEFLPKGQPEWWNTRVEARDFTVSRLAISLKALVDEIKTSFNIALNKNKTELTITYFGSKGEHKNETVSGHRYTGNRFKEFSRTGTLCGRFSLELYRLDKPTGEILFRTGQGPFTKKWGDLMKSAISAGFNQQRAELLAAGYVEGVVTIANLQWDSSRKGFDPNMEDMWIEALCFMEEWLGLAEVKQHMANYEQKNDQEREYGHLKELMDMCAERQKENPDLFQDIFDSLPGSVSNGHTELGASEGTVHARTNSMFGTTVLKRERVRAPRKPQDKSAQKERKTVHLTYTQDPGVSTSRKLHSDQPGLTFGFVSFPNNSYFELDLKRGVLLINRDHPFFLSIKNSDQKVRHYLKAVAIWAFTTVTIDRNDDMQLRTLDEIERGHFKWVCDEISRGKS